ncbi:MAG: acyl-CoA dehydrogenase family protein [Myxococcota bacterium]
MPSYLNDGVLLYIDQLIDWEGYFQWRKGDGFDLEAERSALREVLETASQICMEIEGEAREGWHLSATLEDGKVVHPPHIQRGYEKLRDAGLVSFAVEEEYGGFGLPALVTNMLMQMIARADAGLMTVVGLQAGVAEDIQVYASEELKREYLPRFASGELMGAMDLTEPQAGSDLGAIATRATEKDGEIRLDGEKIYITNGGCEIHLVLARDDDTYDASKGTTSGLSLYLCPRTLPDGSPNGVRVTRLEHKLGIHGSPTAAVAFEGALCRRIASKGDGFKAMLTLMNNARLGVAAQGIGISEAALQSALDYAAQRKQFGVPIGDQPLMKNMLSRMVLALEGSRALLYRACALVDRNRAIEACLARQPELPEGERAELQAVFERNLTRIRLLTPLAKYAATESCDAITRQAIQVHGGLGFMAESEVGKLHNDGIITTIYEGTSEIQVSFALKEIGKGALEVVFDEIRKELEELSEEPLAEYAEKVRRGIEQILEAGSSLLSDFGYALLSARSLADIVINVIVGAELLKQARADRRRFDLAASWINRRMLDVEAKARRIRDGGTERLERAERILALVQ